MSHVIYPILTMLFLSFVVSFLMLTNRVKEMRENKIHPQAISLRSDSSAKLKNSKASDNFLNLFETPVIFYVIGILFLIYKNATSVSIVLMWGYVFSRYVHSYIHCTYNKVMHRFYVFFISMTFLALLFCNFVVNLNS